MQLILGTRRQLFANEEEVGGAARGGADRFDRAWPHRYHEPGGSSHPGHPAAARPAHPKKEATAALTLPIEGGRISVLLGGKIGVLLTAGVPGVEQGTYHFQDGVD